MTNTITDPQEQALMQAVVEAGIALNKAWRTSGDKHVITNLEAEAAETLRNSVFALCDYRAKSSSPEAAPLYIPPYKHRRKAEHWLRDASGKPFVGIWSSDGFWAYAGGQHGVSEIGMRRLDWTYDSPCEYPPDCLPDTRPSDTEVEQADAAEIFSAAGAMAERKYPAARPGFISGKSEVAEQVHPSETRIEPTDEAITDFLANHNWRDAGPSLDALVRAAIIQFHPTPTQTITPVEPEITDEQAAELAAASRYEMGNSMTLSDAHRLSTLSKSPPPTSISNSTLDKIQSIARTREPEQFRNECRDMLRGGG